MAWCAQVTVVPDSSRIRVIIKGRWKVSIGSMFAGGQMWPIASFGYRLASKKAQKKAAKNITSEAMNSDMP